MCACLELDGKSVHEQGKNHVYQWESTVQLQEKKKKKRTCVSEAQPKNTILI